MSRLDLVNQLDGLACGGDQVVPSPRDHEPIRQRKNTVSNRVAMVMIVEKPGVDIALAQGLLDGGQVHIQTLILHDRWTRWISGSCRDGAGPVLRAPSRAAALILERVEGSHIELAKVPFIPGRNN